MQLLRDIPFTAIFWTLTESIRGPLLRSTTDAAPPRGNAQPRGLAAAPEPGGTGLTAWQLVQANAVAAGASGAVAAAATTPFDVIKTQQQVFAGDRSLVDTARAIVRRRGYRGLWAGLLPRSARAVPAGAMVVTTYEILKQHIAARPH